MTSATGELQRSAAGPSRRPGLLRRLRGGFTIVEVLVVIGVITVLFSLVIVASMNMKLKAQQESTRAMIRRLKDRLDEYHQLTGRYPPDGYDEEVKNREGRPIWGAACLYEFLARDFQAKEKVGGVERTSDHAALMKFTEKTELSEDDPDNPGVREVLDAFGLPFHYDNTENGQFEPEKQRDSAHMQPVAEHPADPRADSDTVSRRGPQSAGYDLWSHGLPFSKGHEPNADLNSTIGTWNLDVDAPKPKDES